MVTDGLCQLVGRERSLRRLPQALHFASATQASAGIGALHVTCADEAEHECVEAFQQGFVRFLLPALKLARPAPFRLANLGGRYEWGAARIGENHFAPVDTHDRPALFVVKLNAHVARETTGRDAAGAPTYRWGVWRRLGRDSPCCGALRALLDGSPEPFATDLHDLFTSEGQDRLATLRDPAVVAAHWQPLYAAVASARLQARKVVLDVQDYQPTAPTVFLVLPCVTVNQPDRDTEILCGVYRVEWSSDHADTTYRGLGDTPSAYRVGTDNRGRFVIADDEAPIVRAGRNHRDLVGNQWRERMAGQLARVTDTRLDQLRRDARRNQVRHHHHARALLSVALPILAEVAPVPAAVLLFGEGAIGIHHAFRIHALARDLQGSEEARRMLDEIHRQIDTLEADRAAALVELLVQDYGKSP